MLKVITTTVVLTNSRMVGAGNKRITCFSRRNSYGRSSVLASRFSCGQGKCAWLKICSVSTEFEYDSVIALKYKDGSIGKISANFGSVTKHHHRLALYGTRGTLFSLMMERCIIMGEIILQKK